MNKISLEEVDVYKIAAGVGIGALFYPVTTSCTHESDFQVCSDQKRHASWEMTGV